MINLNKNDLNSVDNLVRWDIQNRFNTRSLDQIQKQIQTQVLMGIHQKVQIEIWDQIQFGIMREILFSLNS